MTDPDRTWLILQVVDSAFPAGAFAHSGGLEAAWQLGDLNSAADLTQFFRAVQEQVATTTAPLMTAVYRDASRFDEVDRFCDAMLTNAVANQASRSQGQAFLAAATRVFKWEPLEARERLVRADRGPCHLAAAFGAVHSAMQTGIEPAVQNFLFVSLRGIVSAAVRLGVVGPIEGQSLQYVLSKESPGWVKACLAIEDIESVCTNSPVLDFYQSLQKRLYSRLFVS